MDRDAEISLEHLVYGGPLELAEQPRVLAGQAPREDVARQDHRAVVRRPDPVHHGLATFRPTRADGHLASRLEVPRGTLLLYIRQVDFDVQGSPVVSSHEHHLADAFEFSVVRRGPGRRFT